MDNLNYSTKVKALLVCGIIGCPLFILVFLIEGTTRTGYNSFRHPVSSLSIGDFGWIQIANFILTGLLVFAFAIGLRHALRSSIGAVWVPLLIGFVGIGLIGAGIFTTDPVYGYPLDKPLLLKQISLSGRLHSLFSVFVFLGLPIACFVFYRRFYTLGEILWASYSAFTGIAMMATFVLAGMGFTQRPGFVDFAGVFQRLSIAIGWIWITLLALHLLKLKVVDNINKLTNKIFTIIMRRRNFLMSLLIIFCLAITGNRLWLYEILVIKGWHGLNWLFKGPIYSPYLATLLTVFAFLIPFILYKQISVKKILPTFFILYTISILYFEVGKQTNCTFMYMRCTIYSVYSYHRILSYLFIPSIFILPFFGRVYWSVTNRFINQNKKSNRHLITLLCFLTIPFSLLTIAIFPSYGSSTDWIDAVKMGYPIFWITIFLGLSGIVIAKTI